MSDVKQLTDEQLQQALGYSPNHMAITKMTNDDLQGAITADLSSEMQSAKSGTMGWNPYIKALQDTANQGPGMLVKGFYNAVPGLSQNVPPQFSKMMANYHPENVKTNPIANVGAQVEEGIGSMAGTLPFAGPLSKAAGMLPIVGNAGILGLGGMTAGGLGFGATGMAQAAGNGQPILPAGMQSFGQGMVYGLGGAVGKGIGSVVGQPLAGQALGMAGAGTMMAPPGQKISGAILGGGFGINRGLEDPQQIIDNEGEGLYRKILNPGKGIINKLEIKSGKDINDSMNLAAQHGLILDSKEGALDNLGAIKQTKQLAKPYYQKLDQILGQNQSNVPGKGGFDLKDLGTQVKKSFDDSNSLSYIKNGQDAAAAKSKVDALIQAEIDRNGQYVNAQKLNTIKQGMWEKSFNPLEPNANDAARQIGFGAKNLIEQAYPSDDIKGLNAQTGRYLTLQKVLEQTHGQGVRGGKLGNHINAAIGGGIGALAGSHIPIPGVGELVGGAIGTATGEFGSKLLNDPKRITTNWANKLNAIKQASMPVSQNPVNNPRGESINPNIMNAELIPKQIGTSMNPILGLPSPRNFPYNPSGIQNTYRQGAIVTPNIGSGKSIEIPPLSRKLRAAYNPKQTIFNVSKSNESVKTPTENPIMGESTQGGGTVGGSMNPINNIKPGVKALALAGGLGLSAMLNQGQAQASSQDANTLKNAMLEATLRTEGLESGQTPLKYTNAAMRKWSTIQGIPIDRNAKPSKGRENFIYVSPDKVNAVIQAQYQRYIDEPKEFGLSQNSTIADLFRKFDQSNPQSKISYFKKHGIDPDSIKIKDLQ